MKKLLIVGLLALSPALFAADGAIVLFGGTGSTLSGGVAGSGVEGESGAVLFGIAGTQSQASTNTNGIAATSVTPQGVVSAHNINSGSQGSTGSAALGLAGAGSDFGAGSASLSGAQGSFGSVGLGAFVNP